MGIKTPEKICYYGKCKSETCDQMNKGGCMYIHSESRLFYRNPEAVEELKERLNKELANFKPVQNSPEQVRAEIERLQNKIEENNKLPDPPSR